jgi:hypothetical protein
MIHHGMELEQLNNDQRWIDGFCSIAHDFLFGSSEKKRHWWEFDTGIKQE